MKKLMDVLPLLLVVVLLFGTACQSNKKKDAESVNVTLNVRICRTNYEAKDSTAVETPLRP